eukprot:16137837-Heterocapsa_arctica.AAC.1
MLATASRGARTYIGDPYNRHAKFDLNARLEREYTVSGTAYWEHACDTYAEASGHQLPEDLKCTIVARWAPGSAREFLRVSSV